MNAHDQQVPPNVVLFAGIYRGSFIVQLNILHPKINDCECLWTWNGLMTKTVEIWSRDE